MSFAFPCDVFGTTLRKYCLSADVETFEFLLCKAGLLTAQGSGEEEKETQNSILAFTTLQIEQTAGFKIIHILVLHLPQIH